MKYVAVYIGSNLDYQFFARMSKALLSLGYEFIFLSNKISIILKAVKDKFGVELIKRNRLVNDIPDLSKCFDIKSGFTSLYQAEILFSSVYIALSKLSLKYRLEYIFIWNGLSIQTMAASLFAYDFNIKTRFFELSNLPGKIFVNPLGVNAKSSLYKNIEILRSYYVEQNEYEIWKSEFIKYKKYEKLTRQGKGKRIQNYLFLIDILGFYFGNLPANGEMNIINKIKNILFPVVSAEVKNFDYKNRPYIFLPLQLNNDTQLSFNSTISNIDLLKTGILFAKKHNIDLLVKIHPLETSKQLINEVKRLEFRYNFIVVDYSTIDLIRNSKFVLTINSTVGLEAKILGKNVIFMGKTFYSLLNNEIIKNYILRYLVDGEYLSRKMFDESTMQQVFSIQ